MRTAASISMTGAVVHTGGLDGTTMDALMAAEAQAKARRAEARSATVAAEKGARRRSSIDRASIHMQPHSFRKVNGFNDPNPRQDSSARSVDLDKTRGEMQGLFLRVGDGFATSNGVYIASVDMGSTAELVGLNVGDEIVEINSVPVTFADDLSRVLTFIDVVDIVVLKVRKTELPDTVAWSRAAAKPTRPVIGLPAPAAPPPPLFLDAGPSAMLVNGRVVGRAVVALPPSPSAVRHGNTTSAFAAAAATALVTTPTAASPAPAAGASASALASGAAGIAPETPSHDVDTVSLRHAQTLSNTRLNARPLSVEGEIGASRRLQARDYSPMAAAPVRDSAALAVVPLSAPPVVPLDRPRSLRSVQFDLPTPVQQPLMAPASAPGITNTSKAPLFGKIVVDATTPLTAIASPRLVARGNAPRPAASLSPLTARAVLSTATPPGLLAAPEFVARNPHLVAAAAELASTGVRAASPLMSRPGAVAPSTRRREREAAAAVALLSSGPPLSPLLPPPLLDQGVASSLDQMLFAARAAPGPVASGAATAAPMPSTPPTPVLQPAPLSPAAISPPFVVDAVPVRVVGSETTAVPRAHGLSATVGPVFVVALDRLQGGLGMTIAGGLDTNLGALFVSTVLPDSATARSGRVSEGDRILAVQGVDTTRMTQPQLVQLLKAQPPGAIEFQFMHLDPEQWFRLQTEAGLSNIKSLPLTPAPPTKESRSVLPSSLATAAAVVPAPPSVRRPPPPPLDLSIRTSPVDTLPSSPWSALSPAPYFTHIPSSVPSSPRNTSVPPRAAIASDVSLRRAASTRTPPATRSGNWRAEHETLLQRAQEELEEAERLANVAQMRQDALRKQRQQTAQSRSESLEGITGAFLAATPATPASLSPPCDVVAQPGAFKSPPATNESPVPATTEAVQDNAEEGTAAAQLLSPPGVRRLTRTLSLPPVLFDRSSTPDMNARAVVSPSRSASSRIAQFFGFRKGTPPAAYAADSADATSPTRPSSALALFPRRSSGGDQGADREPSRRRSASSDACVAVSGVGGRRAMLNAGLGGTAGGTAGGGGGAGPRWSPSSHYRPVEPVFSAPANDLLLLPNCASPVEVVLEFDPGPTFVTPPQSPATPRRGVGVASPHASPRPTRHPPLLTSHSRSDVGDLDTEPRRVSPNNSRGLRRLPAVPYTTRN